jgi:hypothetical protein
MYEPLIHWIHNRENLENLDVATFTGRRDKVTCPHCLRVMEAAPDPAAACDAIATVPTVHWIDHQVRCSIREAALKAGEQVIANVTPGVVTCPECVEHMRTSAQPSTPSNFRESISTDMRLVVLESRVDSLEAQVAALSR